jgi:hypothetical protein
MRAVHLGEALKLAEHSLRGNQAPQAKPQRIKLTLSKKPPASDLTAHGDVQGTMPSGGDDAPHASMATAHGYPPDCGLTTEELNMPPRDLFRLLRRKIHWAEQERDRLKQDCGRLEKARKQEWLAKELVLANIMEAELAVHLKGRETEPGVLEAAKRLKDNYLPVKPLPMTGETTWWREPWESAGEAVAGEGEVARQLSGGPNTAAEPMQVD